MEMEKAKVLGAIVAARIKFLIASMDCDQELLWSSYTRWWCDVWGDVEEAEGLFDAAFEIVSTAWPVVQSGLLASR